MQLEKRVVRLEQLRPQPWVTAEQLLEHALSSSGVFDVEYERLVARMSEAELVRAIDQVDLLIKERDRHRELPTPGSVEGG